MLARKMLGQILISKNDGVHLILRKFKANVLWGKMIKLSGFNLPVTLYSVPPRHPKGQGWPGAEALGTGGLFSSCSSGFLWDPGQSPGLVYLCCQSQRRKLLFLMARRVVGMRSLMPGKRLGLNDSAESQRPTWGTAPPSSSGQGRGSTRAPRGCGSGTGGFWARSPSSPSSAPRFRHLQKQGEVRRRAERWRAGCELNDRGHLPSPVVTE